MKVIVSSHTGNFAGGAERSLRLFLLNTVISKEDIIVTIPHRGWVGDLLAMLRRDGFDVRLMQKYADKSRLETYIKNPRILFRRLIGGLRFSVAYFKLLRAVEPDVVYLNTQRCELEAIVARILDIPIVWHVRGLENDMIGFRRLRVKLILLISRRIITVDSESKVTMEKINIKQSRKVRIVHNGIDVNSIILDHDAIKNIKKQHNLHHKVVIGNVGAVCLRKGVDYFAEVARRTCRSNENACFLWVGPYDKTQVSAKMYQEIRTRHNNLLEEKKLVFAGWQDNPLNWIACFDLFLFTSRSEGFPRVVLEAMALRKNIVAFAVDGVKDMIDDELNGYMISPFDVDKMSSKVIHLISRHSSGAGEQALNKVMDCFQLEDCVNAIEAELISANS